MIHSRTIVAGSGLILAAICATLLTGGCSPKLDSRVKKMADEIPDRDSSGIVYLGSIDYGPFSPTDEVRFFVADSVPVLLVLFDLVGTPRDTLVNGWLKRGLYSTYPDVTNLTSGVYFYHFTAGNYSEQKRTIVMK
jgi:hypothetical protein